MRNLCGRFGFVCWGMGLLAVGTAAQAGKPPLLRPPAERGTGNYGTTAQAGESPLFSLKAVKINPTCTAGDPDMLGQVCASDRQCDTGPFTFDGVCSGDIARTNTVSASPGDIIVAEFFVSQWSPKGQKVKAYQVVIDDAGYFSGGGTLRPLGWDRPDVNISCTEDPCPPEFPVCLPQSVCGGVNHDPGRWAFTDKRLLEADFILAGCQIAGAEDTGTLSFRYGRAAFGSLTCTQAYIGEPKYAGTLVLKLGQDACGTFTLNFRPSSTPDQLPDETGLLDRNNMVIGPLELEGLTIELENGGCPCRIVASTPSDCTIDARQPSEPDGSSPAGWRSIDLEFDNPCASCEFALENFGIREVTGGGDPSIFRVRCTDQNTLTVTFGGPISKDRWTCVEHFESNQEVCLGFLPGDSDGDQMAHETDIVHLLDCLGGEASCADYQCDTDRSGRCTPVDILREIDLLNGAEQYEEWLNESLPVLLGCP